MDLEWTLNRTMIDLASYIKKTYLFGPMGEIPSPKLSMEIKHLPMIGIANSTCDRTPERLSLRQ